MKIAPVVLGLVVVKRLAPVVAEPAAPGEGVYGDAILRQWVQPDYPADASGGGKKIPSCGSRAAGNGGRL